MTVNRDSSSKEYYFIDIDPYTRQIMSWDTETKDRVQVKLKNGCYRVFLTKGQYNKLVERLEKARK
jgi:hypothetical protein